MALITCPECGRTVSDQATECPNCGYPISYYQEGHDNESIPVVENYPSSTPVPTVSKKLSAQKWVIIIVAGLVVAVGAVVGITSLSTASKERKEARAREEYLQKQEEQRQREEERRRQAEEEKQQREEAKVVEAWNFLLNSGVLKSPYSAHLVGYAITKDGHVIIELDSQNSFGAMLRGKCMVFYENGKPYFATGL